MTTAGAVLFSLGGLLTFVGFGFHLSDYHNPYSGSFYGGALILMVIGWGMMP